jgi:hypothetical protein
VIVAHGVNSFKISFVFILYFYFIAVADVLFISFILFQCLFFIQMYFFQILKAVDFCILFTGNKIHIYVLLLFDELALFCLHGG